MMIYRCVVRHARVAPLRHSFAYRSYLWLVDLDYLPPSRFLARFSSGDHLGDPDATIRANVDAFLAGHGIDLGPGGRVLMLANPRVCGYVFNPLTVYWCFASSGPPVAVIAEVHNTYGERHAYLLRGSGVFTAAKEFYVSPFYPVAGEYRMRLPVPGERLALSITMTPPGGRPFVATVAGRRSSVSAFRYPWATLAVGMRIRWHGILLYLRGLPVAPRPVHTPQEGVR